ncbi:MAG TPA: HAD-IIIC family phosphatase [Myxococcota bacterium]|nr:HAD-IIIC family phosphatase [Myxococcota bacterium]
MSLFPLLSRLKKEGQLEEALTTLRAALRREEVAVEDYERAGRWLHKEYSGKATNVRVLGICTTAWIPPVLTACGWGRGMPLRVSDGDYDNILQELERGEAPDVMVFLPWTQRLLSGDDSQAAIQAELGFWQVAWSRLRGAKLVQVGYDWMGPGPEGAALAGAPGGKIDRIRRMNAELRARLPSGAAWVDLEQLSGEHGRKHVYDSRQYHWTKNPFSARGLWALGQQLTAAIRSVLTGPKKVLVLDLDNTVWGGVVGETGPMGISIRETPEGESYRAFQTFCKGLTKRGVLLAVASKNNAADAKEPFIKNPDMVLKLEDFAGFEATWDPKALSLRRLADQLRLGLDSFVFFDDNPAERELIRQHLPEVEVPEVPEDPSGYVRYLEEGMYFEALSLTKEDRERASQYQAEQARESAAAAFDSLDGYLNSLEMKAEVRAVDEDDLERVVQLLGKTNQFNLTTRRHSAEQVRAWMQDPACVALTVRVDDRFGGHGLVAVMLGVPDEDGALRVDTWLMSCRVIGRTVEQYCWLRFVAEARARGYQRVRGEYLPTAKNAQVAPLFGELGLPVAEERPDGSRLYVAEIEALPEVRTFVQ